MDFLILFLQIKMFFLYVKYSCKHWKNHQTVKKSNFSLWNSKGNRLHEHTELNHRLWHNFMETLHSAPYSWFDSPSKRSDSTGFSWEEMERANWGKKRSGMRCRFNVKWSALGSEAACGEAVLMKPFNQSELLLHWNEVASVSQGWSLHLHGHLR